MSHRRKKLEFLCLLASFIVLASCSSTASHSRSTTSQPPPAQRGIETIGVLRVPQSALGLGGMALASNHLWIATIGVSVLEGLRRPTPGTIYSFNLSNNTARTEVTGTLPSLAGNGKYVWVATAPSQEGTPGVPPSPAIPAVGGGLVVQFDAQTRRRLFTYAIARPLQIFARGSTAWVLAAESAKWRASELLMLHGGRQSVLAKGIFGVPLVQESLVWCDGRVASLTMRSGASYEMLSSIPSSGGSLRTRPLRLPGVPLVTCASSHLLVTAGRPGAAASATAKVGTFVLDADGAGSLSAPFAEGAIDASTAGGVLWLSTGTSVAAYNLNTRRPIPDVPKLPVPSFVANSGLLASAGRVAYVINGVAVLRLAV